MKENIRINKKRIIFWGVFCIITVILSISGIAAFNKGYGKIGSKRILLIPVAEEFNRVDSIIKRGGITATVNGEKLIVKDTNRDDVYTYELKEQGNIKYITCSYGSMQKKVGDIVALAMVEAVYKVNNGTESFTNYYNLESLKKTTLDQGAKYSSDKENVIMINLKTNILNNILGKVDTLQEDAVIKAADLTEMETELTTKKTFLYEKGDTVIYIKNENTLYDMYVSYKDPYVLNNSVANIIKILKPELYEHIFDENGEINFVYNSTEYRLYTNVHFNESGIFANPNGIFEIKIYK